ncbi:MAG: carboxymuconolactone decarboxylase family protein [Planctomycetaceae bacterium]|nr:carboxymuconolactone decarboxylase family protein [Planctomycetaceae bacterium]
MARLPEFDPSALTPDQQDIFDSIVEKRGSVPAPHKIWLTNPGLARHTHGLGWYFQHESTLPQHLYEMAILLVARHWEAEYAWQTHVQRAAAAGLAEDIIADLRARRRPAFGEERNAEAVIFEFVTSLQDKRAVSQVVYNRALDLLGQSGLVDLTGLVGYFTMLSATLTVFEIGPDA